MTSLSAWGLLRYKAARWRTVDPSARADHFGVFILSYLHQRYHYNRRTATYFYFAIPPLKIVHCVAIT